MIPARLVKTAFLAAPFRFEKAAAALPTNETAPLPKPSKPAEPPGYKSTTSPVGKQMAKEPWEESMDVRDAYLGKLFDTLGPLGVADKKMFNELFAHGAENARAPSLRKTAEVLEKVGFSMQPTEEEIKEAQLSVCRARFAAAVRK